MNRTFILIAAMMLWSLSLTADENEPAVIEVESLPDMPVAITNNAVALLSVDDELRIYSLLGLESGKTWADASSIAMQYTESGEGLTGTWRILDSVPGEHGRLAASAVAAGGEIYLFGGYTVASDGAEESTPEVFRLDGESGRLVVFSTMPVPVEDSVVAVYQDRWIYLVSGWHDVGNVNLVQVLDIESGEWAQATPYPGNAVFGHAGGMADGTLVVCDGVRIEYQSAPEPRKFLPADECWKGTIDKENHRRIDWRQIDAHPGEPLYRMAAGDDGRGRIWFAGGSDNPYNFNGMGYDGRPSEPNNQVFSYDPSNNRWEIHGKLGVATMDHRGLLHHDGWFYIVGGMRAGQVVSKELIRFRP